MTSPSGLPFPPQPVFASLADQRRDSQAKLTAAFRIFAKLGFDEGVMGHISFRDPEHRDRMWMNPLGVSFGLLRVSDLQCIGLDGKLISGDGFAHIGGVPLHSAVYRGRPEVRAVVHTHAPRSKTWSTLGRLLAPISVEAAVFHGRHVLYDSFASGEGSALAEAAEGNRAVIMQSHGAVTFGETVDEAAYLFMSLEKVCAEQLRAGAVGTPQPIPEDKAASISAGFGPYMGWLNFQPAYQAIVKEQADLLE